METDLVLQGTRALLGRKSPGSDPEIVIDDERVSRQHALFTFRDNGWYVEKFKGGTLTINGREINETVQLTHGDVIGVFEHKFNYKAQTSLKRSRHKKVMPVILLLVSFSLVLFLFYTRKVNGENSQSKTSIKINTEELQKMVLEAAYYASERKNFPERYEQAISLYNMILSTDGNDSVDNLIKVKRNRLIGERDSILSDVLLTCKILKRQGQFAEVVKIANEGLRYFPDPASKERKKLLSVAEEAL
ncbi:MAG: FHA domain-containing protein [Fibrobacteres bacterium]|nr:FHA domain-containing protein [Fibrobacterota bacterium]